MLDTGGFIVPGQKSRRFAAGFSCGFGHCKNKKIFLKEQKIKCYSLSHWPGFMDDRGIVARVSLSVLSWVSCPPGYFGTGLRTKVWMCLSKGKTYPLRSSVRKSRKQCHTCFCTLLRRGFIS